MHNTNPTREIGVLLFGGFSNHCLANAVEPLRAANTLTRQPLYRWEYLGMDTTPVTASSGLPVTPTRSLSTHPGGALLLVLPSYGHLRHATPTTSRALRAARRRFAWMAGLDMGAWLMAQAGLLDGQRATVHWDELGNFAETFPEVHSTEDRFVLQSNPMSCGGGVTALELMLAVIARDHGRMLALEVGALFMHGERAPGTATETASTPDQIVRAAAATMRRNIEDPLPIHQIAAGLGLGRRALEVHFARYLGKTPRAAYRAIRLAEARRLAETSRLSVAEIATRCGYENASALTRAFRQVYGTSPTAIRAGSAAVSARTGTTRQGRASQNRADPSPR